MDDILYTVCPHLDLGKLNKLLRHNFVKFILMNWVRRNMKLFIEEELLFVSEKNKREFISMCASEKKSTESIFFMRQPTT